jgi:septum formation topological specificity factor MinE
MTDQTAICNGCKPANRPGVPKPITMFLDENGKKFSTCTRCRNKGKKYNIGRDDLKMKNKLLCLVDCAKNYNILWDPSLTDSIAIKLTQSKCYYCEFIPFGYTNINGNQQNDGDSCTINRLDPSIGYTIDNCVGCCSTCRKMIGSLDTITFIKRCKHIIGVEQNESSFHRTNQQKNTFASFIKGATLRNIEFDLELSDVTRYFHEKCEFCEIENCNGMDRWNSDLGYTISNVISCCSECNIMKKDIAGKTFIDMCKKIACKFDKLPEYLGSTINKSRYQFDRNPIVQTIDISKSTITNQHATIPSQSSTRTYEKGTNLPENSGINPEDIPLYCYYDQKNDGFVYNKKGTPGKKSFNKKKTLKERLQVIVNFVNKSNEPVTSTAIQQLKQKKTQQEIMKDKFVRFSPEQLSILMEMKNKVSTDYASKQIKEHLGIYLERSHISKFWEGLVELPDKITSLPEYKTMVALKKSRVYD